MISPEILNLILTIVGTALTLYIRQLANEKATFLEMVMKQGEDVVELRTRINSLVSERDELRIRVRQLETEVTGLQKQYDIEKAERLRLSKLVEQEAIGAE